MISFIGFAWFHDGEMHVDAIDDRGLPHDALMAKMLADIPWFNIFAPSRNQARRRVFEVAIMPSGRGFGRVSFH